MATAMMDNSTTPVQATVIRSELDMSTGRTSSNEVPYAAASNVTSRGEEVTLFPSPVPYREQTLSQSEEVTLPGLYHVYRLIHEFRMEFRREMNSVRADISEIRDKVDNVSSRIVLHDHRISVLEDDMDNRVGPLERLVNDVVVTQDNMKEMLDISDFPADTTVVAFGMTEKPTEDIKRETADLVQYGLGMVNCQIVNATRLPSKNGKPGLVKVQFRNKDEKIKALRCKRNLAEVDEYRRVYLRSSMSHTERLIQHNFQTILNGNTFKLTGNGRLVNKDEPLQQNLGAWSRGPPAPAHRDHVPETPYRPQYHA